MIHDHPNCTYYGCDIADTVNKKVNCKQFTFTRANVTKRLPYEDNTFDLVHMRLFIAALREDEWPAAINEVLRVTKPGGMVQLMEYDPKVIIRSDK
jgi:ubiquinone/menaquinone biosynthesis C-methylase UbiE